MDQNNSYINVNGSPATGWYVWQVIETGMTTVNPNYADVYIQGADDEYLYMQCHHYWTEEAARDSFSDDAAFINKVVIS